MLISKYGEPKCRDASPHERPTRDVEGCPRGECRGHGHDLSTLGALFSILPATDMMRLEDGALTGCFVCLAGSKCRTAERGEYFCVGCVNFRAFRHPVGRWHLQLAHDFLRPVPRQAAQSPLHDQSFPSEWCVALCTA